MEHATYNCSLCVALPLMLFFGFYFLLAGTPDKAVFKTYLRSRRVMGAALLLLAANYAAHLLTGVRFRDADAAIAMNLSTYFLCYWLFISALITLLDRAYLTGRRTRAHIGLWAAFSALCGCVLLLPPGGAARKAVLAVAAAGLVGYGLFLARRLLLAYRGAVRMFDDTRSDDMGRYVRWLSVFTWWALIYGVGCGLLTFLPDRWVFVWILSSVPFYVYLFCCYLNYMLFHERVETAMEEEKPAAVTAEAREARTGAPAYHAEIAERIKEWVEAEGYVRPGLTIRELADILRTNRTYLSEYIKTTYSMTFRDWIAGLRVEYAKRLMTLRPELTVAGVSSSAGFLSPSHFTKTFKEKEGRSPARWKKAAAGGGPA